MALLVLLLLLVLVGIGIGLLALPFIVIRLTNVERALREELDALRGELAAARKERLARRAPAAEAPPPPRPAPAAPPPPPPPPRPRPVVTPPPRPIVTPPPPPRPEPEPSPLAAWLGRLTAVAWEWLSVRGRFAPAPGTPRETALAAHWLIRVGVLTVLAGFSFFVRWAVARGVLGPWGRCALTALAGAALVAGGAALLRTRYRLVGEGLAGVGTVALYFAFYAASAMFGLVPAAAGFAGMALLTAGCGLFALGRRLPSVAALATVGGMLTPVLLRAETANLPMLYGYLGLLAVCVGAGALWRRWDALAVLGFALAWVVTLLAPWGAGSQAWFLILHLLAVAYGAAVLARREGRATWLLFAAQVANLAAFWGAVFASDAPDAAGAGMAAVLLAAHGALAWAARRLGARGPTWCGTLMALVDAALGVTFALGVAETALAWCLLAAAATELGLRVRERALVDLGQCLGLFALFAALVVALGRGVGVSGAVALTRSGLCLAGTALVGLHAHFRVAPSGAWRGQGAALLAWALALPYVPLIVWQCMMPDDVACLVTFAAVAALCAFVPLALRPTVPWLRRAAFVVTFAATLGMATFGLMLALGPDSWWDWPGLPAAVVVLAAHLWALGLWAPGRAATRAVAGVVFGVALTRFAHDLGGLWPGEAAGVAVSVAWALYALGLMAAGLWRGSRPARLAGLGLFAATVLKVFLADLAGTALVWRVAAALPVGALLILGAVLYLRLGAPPRGR